MFNRDVVLFCKLGVGPNVFVVDYTKNRDSSLQDLYTMSFDLCIFIFPIQKLFKFQILLDSE